MPRGNALQPSAWEHANRSEPATGKVKVKPYSTGAKDRSSDCSGPSFWMVLVLRRSCSGDQRLFEVLAERGLQRVELARRGIAQIGLENLLDPWIPLFLIALELLLVGPE